MKKIRLKQIENAVSAEQPPEVSPEEHRANVDLMFEMMSAVAAKLPPNQPPINESLDELLAELKNGVKRQPVIIHTDNSSIRYDADGSPEILNSGVAGSVAVRNPTDDTCIDAGNDTFTESELQILKQFNE